MGNCRSLDVCDDVEIRSHQTVGNDAVLLYGLANHWFASRNSLRHSSMEAKRQLSL